eukprot:TRINITY_DN5979_c0_g1_i1.p1 TRINITY_DN5979_c0_g1~~TRINITY_DN5979_c0_g1_i1.p1  ORF type:complete len:332 (+),score=40.51 TRINITY_DN5979_c0_g1_i1:159-1154(+)
MQVFMSFPDSGFPDVVFEVVAESLVSDAAKAAASEWGVDAEFLEVSFCGLLIPSNSRLLTHGIEGSSQLVVSFPKVFGREWFTNVGKRKKLMEHLSSNDEQHLSLDTPSFATDGHFSFDMSWIQSEIKVSFVNPDPSITSAGCKQPEFGNYSGLPVASVELLGLKNITLVGDNFLSKCAKLASLDVGCLNNVTSIGDNFMAECSSLSSLDLRSFNNVTVIGNCFLGGCSSLSSADLARFTNVTSIGHNFLVGCSSLTSLDLSNLNSLTKVGNNFLACTSISSLDLTSLGNVTAVGNWFCYRCPALMELNTRGLPHESAIRKRVEQRQLGFN